MPNIKIQKTGVKIYLLCQGFSPLLILALGLAINIRCSAIADRSSQMTREWRRLP